MPKYKAFNCLRKINSTNLKSEKNNRNGASQLFIALQKGNCSVIDIIHLVQETESSAARNDTTSLLNHFTKLTQ